MEKLALLNSSLLTTAGSYILTDITLDQARKLVTDNLDNLDSAIGHASTAEIMTALLGVNVPINRQMFSQKIGQTALVFKLNARPAEGKVLTAEEIETLGYKFQVLKRDENGEGFKTDINKLIDLYYTCKNCMAYYDNFSSFPCDGKDGECERKKEVRQIKKKYA